MTFIQGKEIKQSPAQRILTIESERQHAMWFSEYFVSKGYDVSIATNIGEGMNILQARPIYGVPLNLDGVGKNCSDMVTLIRTHSSQIPMFVMSAILDREMINDSFAEGVKGFLSKPILDDQ